MSRKQQYFFISMMMLLVTATCQAGGSPVPTSTAKPTQTVTDLPLFTLSTSTVSAENSIHTIFPSFSLTGPNTVCVQHYYYALSCLDSTGWHIYKNEYDETSNPRSTIPRAMMRCPDGRIYLDDAGIYQVKGETLVDIGGAFDQGAIVCGSGNEIWVNDMNGVSHFDGSIWTSYPVEEYFESHNDEFPYPIYSLAGAPNGNVWVTTNKTIATFDGSKWEILTPPGNLTFSESGGQMRGLVIDSSGTVWAITYPETCCIDNQLLKYDGTQWTTFPGPDNFYQMKIIAADHENRIWAATGGNKIYTFDPKTNGWDLQFDVRQLGLGKRDESAIDGMEFDGQGRLWVATDYGLGIYDGVTWTTYHIHTANLYIPADLSKNDITALFIFGDGPPLPALEIKAPGSVRGRLVSGSSSSFTDAQVEICLMPVPVPWDSSGGTPCADQAYHALADVNADGSFVIPNVPIGSYYLMIKLSNAWAPMVHSGYIDVFMLEDAVNFIVNTGTETQLGDISTP